MSISSRLILPAVSVLLLVCAGTGSAQDAPARVSTPFTLETDAPALARTGAGRD